tara:strand:- start:53 stop:526 length:474 start_codon:yes stop_codon:yes gene_type:complete
MSLVALTNFITITKPNGSVAFSPTQFQNGKYDEVVYGYSYLSFIYQGATRSRSGDNLESSLILANNAISMNYAQQAVINKYHIKVETYLMNDTFSAKKETIPITSEEWLAASLSYDPQTIEVLLSSAIDAVGANAPNRVLTRRMVGALPVTGQIQAR